MMSHIYLFAFIVVVNLYIGLCGYNGRDSEFCYLSLMNVDFIIIGYSVTYWTPLTDKGLICTL
jgi:hypothetical protein